MKLDEFVSGTAGHEACVGIVAPLPSSLAPPIGVELRTVDGATMETLDALFDGFAKAWHFPPWFGRNMNAFNDFMRDLDNMINTAEGKPPAPGYLTYITDAHLLLIKEPEAFSWFAKKIPFYRDYYRDEADPPAAFGLLLSVPTSEVDAIRERWLTVGTQVAIVTV
ncbi:barstar family protein [Mycobacterium sp. IEC1808]|uniref:barstar family protein n=1 Tax=Mycobacterium sp. IEC1808 TaxID=1743230 RepID=UPI0024090193|nr:barstar family protein [Mycobacterium sp. IEC1808]